MKINKILSIISLIICAAGFLTFTKSGVADPANLTVKINGHSQVSLVEGQEFVDLVTPLIDSLEQRIVDALNEVDGFSFWVNSGKSGAQIGSPVSLSLHFQTNGYTLFTFTLHDLDADLHFKSTVPLLPDIDVFYHAPVFALSGIMEPDSQTVQDVDIETPGDTVVVLVGGTPGSLPAGTEESIFEDLEASLLNDFQGGSTLADLLNILLGGQVPTENLQQILTALLPSQVSNDDIILSIVIDNFSGESIYEIIYEQPYAGPLLNLDTPPVRGLMFSSSNILFTKRSLGFSGGDLTQYDDVYSDEEQFFQLLDNLNIKFIRSDINWRSVEPQLDPITTASQPTGTRETSQQNDFIDDYIAAHAQVFNNLEAHFQLANQYLYDFVVTIGEGRSAPRDPQTGKEFWVSDQENITEEDFNLGYDPDIHIPITRSNYLAALERHVRAVVRRLKTEINFWQVENELNQADLAALANSQETSRRKGSAWAHVDFLDVVMQTMANAIKLEDLTARITHNFHPFRIRKIQDWEQYLDVIGLTYHPNFQMAFPLLGFSSGDFVRIAYHLLGGTSKPVWVLSVSYPAMLNSRHTGWDFSKDRQANMADFNTARQVQWVSDALSSSGSAQAEAFLYRTYQAENPNGPPSSRPNNHAGLIFTDGTPKASHDDIINSLRIDDFSVAVMGPDSLAPGQVGSFNASPTGGVVKSINRIPEYVLYRWERRELAGDWQEIDSGPQQMSINQSGTENFWLRCEVTDHYGFKKMSNELPVVVDENVSLDISIPDPGLPDRTSLTGNYPNPFNPTTTIQYSLNNPAQVTLRIMNSLGQVVRTLVNERQPAGYQTVQWEGKNDLGQSLPSGVYFYRLEVGEYVATKKMVLMK
jgi:hypothetical protein